MATTTTKIQTNDAHACVFSLQCLRVVKKNSL